MYTSTRRATDGSEYDLYRFNDLDEAADFIYALDEESSIMCPLDGIWLTQKEAKTFLYTARERDLREEAPGDDIVLAVMSK